MEGTARRVQRAQEGTTSVLRFLLVCDDGAATPVEMRGAEVRGLLDDGDRVVLTPGPEPPAPDGLHRPASVQNRTTGSVVTAWRPPLVERAGRPLVAGLLSATISSVVTIVVGVVVNGGGGEEASDVGPAPGVDGETDGTDWFPFASPIAILEILALSAIAWLIWFAAFGRRRRRAVWPVAVGVLLGVTAGLWVFAVIDGSELG